MNKTERHQEILNLLISKERIEINELCEMFHIVPMTARRDLKELEEQGYLTLRGKVPTKYFVKRFYGVKDTCEIPQEEGKEWFHA